MQWAAMMSFLPVFCKTFFILLFAMAVIHKLSDFERFTGYLAHYNLLTETWLRQSATFLIAAEILTIVLLLSASWDWLGACLACGLLGLYAASILRNLMIGNTAIACGCGGPVMHLSFGLVLRNLLLMSMALPLLLIAPSSLSWADSLVVIASSVATFMSFLIIEQWLANATLRDVLAHHSANSTFTGPASTGSAS